MDFNLKYPVKVGEHFCDKIILPERVKLKHIIQAEQYDISTASADHALCAALSDEPEIVIKEIDIEDWALIRVEIGKVWQKYFGITANETETQEGNENPIVATV